MEQTLSSYHIFYTAAKSGNISKAAAKLFISQPAVSKSIQKLESSLGCRLFVRSSRGVTLTEEGNILFEHVREAFETLDAGEEKIRRVSGLGIGHLKIGVSSTLCKYVLLPYLKEFVQKNPQIHISIACQSTSETLRLLADDRLDIGLAGLGSYEMPHTLLFDFIAEAEDVFVASRPYLLYLKQCGVSDSEILQNCSLMMLDKNNISRQYIDEYMQKNQISVRECIEASSMDLLIEFAKIGLGAACVIRQFIEPELADGSLIEIPLPVPVLARSIGFVYKPGKHASKPLEQFLDFYHQSADAAAISSAV